MQRLFSRSEQTKKNGRTRALVLGIAISCQTPRPPLPTIVEKKADWIGLEPSISRPFGGARSRATINPPAVCTQPHQSRQPQTVKS